MKRQTYIIIILGLAALAVIVSRCSRQQASEQQVEVPAAIVGEGIESGEENQATETSEATAPVKTEESGIRPVQELAEPESKDSQGESDPIVEGEEKIEAQAEQSTRPETIDEPRPVAATPDPSPEIEVTKPEEPETLLVVENESEEERETESISSETVDEIEGSLSVSDYAKGLTLLSKLPVETVDRFVELRKDGFTAEEQAEVKAILLESYEGEDLEWIVKTYHKLRP